MILPTDSPQWEEFCVTDLFVIITSSSLPDFIHYSENDHLITVYSSQAEPQDLDIYFGYPSYETNLVHTITFLDACVIS